MLTGERLTSREIEVLQLLEEGLVNKEIAGQLGISINTIRAHVRTLMVKTGRHTRSGLAVYSVMAFRGLN